MCAGFFCVLWDVKLAWGLQDGLHAGIHKAGLAAYQNSWRFQGLQMPCVGHREASNATSIKQLYLLV